MSALDDLIERLKRASAELGRLSERDGIRERESWRLRDKREGVELALSYAREAKRDEDNAADEFSRGYDAGWTEGAKWSIMGGLP